jgi:hypothetical protein
MLFIGGGLYQSWRDFEKIPNNIEFEEQNSKSLTYFAPYIHQTPQCHIGYSRVEDISEVIRGSCQRQTN